MEENNKKNESQKQIAGAIIIAGVIIAGAILLRGNIIPTTAVLPTKPTPFNVNLKVNADDRVLGSAQAKVAIIMYEDFQCPFCGKSFNESEINIINTYVKNGDVQFVFRDWAFLGPESTQAALAARCAGDQGKFWEYHSYLFTHQNGENKGAFSDANLKSFAKTLGLNIASFNSCFDSNKYIKAIADSRTKGAAAGVTGTPKGFILKDGKTVDIINGAEPFASIKQKIDNALR